MKVYAIEKVYATKCKRVFADQEIKYALGLINEREFFGPGELVVAHEHNTIRVNNCLTWKEIGRASCRERV
jgi:hypothetical protein